MKNKDSSEFECWKVILQPNINLVRWSCDHDLTNQQRMSSRHCTNIVEDVSQTRPRQACVSLTCPRQYQDISNLHIFELFHPRLCRLQKSRDVLDVLSMSWVKVVACPACVIQA